MAEIYEGLGKPDLAISFYEKASLQFSNSNKSYTLLVQKRIADLCYQLGRVDQSLSYYEMVLVHEPENYEALYRSADLIYSKKKFVKARQLLETLQLKYPRDVQSKLLLSKVLAKLHQYAMSEHYLHTLIDQGGLDDGIRLEAQEVLADNYFASKNYVQSAEIYDALLVESQVLQDEERYLKVLKNLLYCLIIKRDLKAAQYTYENYSQNINEADKLDILYYMAEGLWKIGEYYRSIKTVHDIYKRQPKFRDVKNTVEKYKNILENSNLRFLFTQELNVARQYITQAMGLGSSVEVVFGISYILFFDDTRTIIVNLSPFPVFTNDAQQIKKQLVMHDVIRMSIEFYSYCPMSQEMRDVFMLQEIKEFFGSSFVEQFK